MSTPACSSNRAPRALSSGAPAASPPAHTRWGCVCVRVSGAVSVIERMQPAIYCPNEIIVREGTPGKAIFLINQGHGAPSRALPRPPGASPPRSRARLPVAPGSARPQRRAAGGHPRRPPVLRRASKNSRRPPNSSELAAHAKSRPTSRPRPLVTVDPHRIAHQRLGARRHVLRHVHPAARPVPAGARPSPPRTPPPDLPASSSSRQGRAICRGADCHLACPLPAGEAALPRAEAGDRARRRGARPAHARGGQAGARRHPTGREVGRPPQTERVARVVEVRLRCVALGGRLATSADGCA